MSYQLDGNKRIFFSSSPIVINMVFPIYEKSGYLCGVKYAFVIFNPIQGAKN